ncbi:MAG: hypothetical protein C4524_04850 [Candidatus Zixiibacteriota bacterium]|nr:MAG: hypothetical protein C4524_04850 [candidate division Zixibacteria bacterium]
MTDALNRVRSNAPGQIEDEVRRQMRGRLCYYATAEPSEIDQRLKQLDSEWDVERILLAGSAGLLFYGLIRGLFGSRVWLLPGLALSVFLVQHSALGWSLPANWLRRLGLRTAEEIEEERFALKAMRGDFRGVSESIPLPEAGAIDRILEAVERP